MVLAEKSFHHIRAKTAGVPGFREKLTDAADCIKYSPGKRRKHGLISNYAHFAQAAQPWLSKTCRCL
jgi:hypothetical protein